MRTFGKPAVFILHVEMFLVDMNKKDAYLLENYYLRNMLIQTFDEINK